MSTQIFVNLPVKDLNKSVAFFKQLGYSFNPQFTDENATCMIISDTIYVMLLTEPFFKTFTKKQICNTSKSIESIICLSAESRAAVDKLVEAAKQAGGLDTEDANDQGFMYSRAYEDLDGHRWEIMWMDPSAVNPS